MEVIGKALNDSGGLWERITAHCSIWSYQVTSSLKITNSSTQSFVPVDLQRLNKVQALW